ncbi:hypothetical protein [Paenibacillus pasadenensis]|uniref:hypothetical protein n=1 Tax=Paenibacillus pasadenensis TaxID=217090 RepID=UPI0011AFB649|nr:hypothetical protein [Paenibacillus pasadenensis]
MNNHRFAPGSVYFARFPKLEQVLDRPDYNMDSMKPGATPRPVFVLRQLDEERVLIAPSTTEKLGKKLDPTSFVPISGYAMDKPGVLSYAKVSQIQPMPISKLLPADNPIQVDQLRPVDLDRVMLGSIYVTQTEQGYAKWISDIVSKNVRLDPQQLERQMTDELSLPDRPTESVRFPFKRGDIYMARYQPEIGNSDPARLTGQHPSIFLTDGENMHIPVGQTVVVPVLPNTEEYARYFSKHDVLLGDQRACMNQLQPMNRSWTDQQLLGQLTPGQQLEIDRGVLTSLGMREHIIERSKSLIQERLATLEPDPRSQPAREQAQPQPDLRPKPKSR